ncbi:hypothetical protein [Hyphomonas chukchiensis]|uniref:VWFA domain-containing protein n=1 Tax=Hyphomonas chukchiensis TaxID=1280947 RepID=A0A062ULU2_9PROT|nr:hypothetical protein [Hyphomonas chukchiensis]KCZ57554.1 hypothetical protein HY30_05105 [Hyphomonas chukchiensis]
MRRVLLAVALVLAGCSGSSGSEPGAQAAGYCAFGKTSSLFLIDQTTPYDDTDRAVISESIGTVVDQLGPGDRIVLATIGEHYTQSARLINACKPGCPDGQGALDSMMGGCSSMKALADERQFMGSLAQTLRPAVQGSSSADHSAIMSTIAQWTQAPPGDQPFTHVYIFSDMLENSQAVPWTEFRSMAPDAALKVAEKFNYLPAVRGADVRIVGFGRSHNPGRPPLEPELDARLREFWAEYFREGGASVTFEGAIRN